MNCSTFRKKIYDYIEENVVLDMKEAMDMHMSECSECRGCYEEELRLEELLKKAFSVEDVEFVSSRATIIKSIDKNKYTQKPLWKPFEHFKKYGMRYMASAAALVCAILIIPSMFGGAKKSTSMSKSESSRDMALVMGADQNGSAANMMNSAAKSTEQPSMQGMQQSSQETKGAPSYLPVFASREKTTTFQAASARPWTTSPNGKLQATVEGKGAAALEEGVATIIVKDNVKNKMTEFYLSNNKDNKYTPMFVEWLNDENLLVVVGEAQGTLAFGGNLYEVNVNNSSTAIVYQTKSNLEQVMKVQRKNNLLDMTVRVFKDSSMSAYNDENREIDLTGINIK